MLVRADELWLVMLAAVVGLAAGLIVVGMNQTTLLAHRQLFHSPAGQRLSAPPGSTPGRRYWFRPSAVLVLGFAGLCLARFWPRRAVDPIEANALYGGVMSLTDSLVVVGQTLLSNGVGASVGLEAGYTQISAAVASKFGRSFRVRRNDLRLLVGCGAAAAISAAFNAPLTGAFYGFELVIGAYTLANLAPVVVAAICGTLMMRLFEGDEPGFALSLPATFGTADFLPVLVLGRDLRPGRHLHHARRHADRDAVSPQPSAGMGAAGDRRPGGRHAGPGFTFSAVVGPRGAAQLHRCALLAAACRLCCWC